MPPPSLVDLVGGFVKDVPYPFRARLAHTLGRVADGPVEVRRQAYPQHRRYTLPRQGGTPTHLAQRIGGSLLRMALVDEPALAVLPECLTIGDIRASW